MVTSKSTKAAGGPQQGRLTGSFAVSKRGGLDKSMAGKIAGIETKKPAVQEFVKAVPQKTVSDELSRDKLDPEKSAYKKLFEELTANRIAEPVHQESYDSAEKLLRQFDMTASYGPVEGLSRIERWTRAHKLGLNPPALVKEILETDEGTKNPVYRESYLYIGGQA